MAGSFFTATRENNNPADYRLLGTHYHLLFHPQVDSQHRSRHGILGSIRWRYSSLGQCRWCCRINLAWRFDSLFSSAIPDHYRPRRVHRDDQRFWHGTSQSYRSCYRCRYYRVLYQLRRGRALCNAGPVIPNTSACRGHWVRHRYGASRRGPRANYCGFSVRGRI